MFFNSIEFAIFLPSTFLIYWLLDRHSLKLQNLFLLAASYLFYGWWDWRFLTLIVVSSAVDFSIGISLKKTVDNRKRKWLLAVSLAVNLGLLGFFKYFNFFIESFIAGFTLFGTTPDIHPLNIVLPVGISFYTFQTLSYTIDVYRKKIAPTTDVIAFFAFVAFFPQLVAGPIERAKNLLNQFTKKRRFNYDKASDGMRQILWGLVKKCLIADNCAVYVNQAFESYQDASGSTLLLAAVFFAFQIYGDFSGYSDIAIGSARLFGFDLMKNFAFPYFSRDIAEFWRRWHISLTTWFRDYLYIPMGGSRSSRGKNIRNVFVVFLVSGMWHGANWTFLIWGLLHAFYFLPLMLANRNRRYLDVVAASRLLPSPKEMLQILITFFITCFAWIFFRAENLTHAISCISKISSLSILSIPQIPYQLIALITIFILAEWIQREKEHTLQIDNINNIGLRWAIYYGLLIMLNIFSGEKQAFIYFQF